MKRLTPFKRFLTFSLAVSFILSFVFFGVSLASSDKTIYGPTSKLDSLDAYKTSSKEDPFSIAQKIDSMVSSLSADVSAMVTHPSITADRTPTAMMTQADAVADEAKAVYQHVHAMYSQVDAMEGGLEGKTQGLKANPISEADANNFNASTRSMSTQVGGMRQSLAHMKQQISEDKQFIDQMPDALGQMADYGAQVEQYDDQLNRNIKEASSRFESMDRDLKAQGLESPDAANGARQYLSSLPQFVKERKQFTSQELDYIKGVKKYLGQTSNYLGQTLSNIDKTDKNLSDIQLFFINSKARPGQEGAGPLNLSPQEMPAADACANVRPSDENPKEKKKGKALMSLQACQKSCHSVCRQKAKTSSGQGCFECPSGSPDTCYDVGMFPANISWCQPGGVCYQDPELTCQFLGALGPNKMPLSCAVCKQVPDECFAKIGNDTTNLTHCIQTCPGTCEYKGKYKVSDNPTKFEHCYSCKKIAAPTCESLGWGWTSEDMCTKNCPDGDCVQSTITLGLNEPLKNPPPAGPNGGQNGGQNNGGGQCGGGQCGQGGAKNGGDNQTGAGGGTTNPGDPGNQPNPPTDGQPSSSGGGGGATVAGGSKPDSGSGNTGQGPQTNKAPDNKGSVDQPPKPASTETKDPGKPQTEDKPKLPDNPTLNPPDAWNVNFYTRWLNDIDGRIKKYQDIANNPNEAEGVKTMVRKDLEDMTQSREEVAKKLKKAQDDFNTQQKNYEDTKKYIDNYYKTRPKPVDYAKEAERKGQEYKTKQLKDATDALQTKIKEAKESITNRKERIDKLSKDIDLLKKENDYLTQAKNEGNLDGDFVENKVSENEKKINELTQQKNELTKALNTRVREYNEEINKLKSEYQRAYWQYNENARRTAEVERMNEYRQKYDEYKRAKKAKEIRDKAFDDTRKNLQAEQTRAKENGDTSKADELQRQIDNLDRGQKQWDDQQDRRIANLDDDLYHTGQRNFNEGAGPYSPENLGEKYNTYIGYVDKNIADTQKALADGKITQAQANQQLNDLNSVRDELVREQNDYKSESSYSPEDIQRISQSAMTIVNSAMGTDADKSFAQLFGESLVEEAAHNLNPLVALKKSWAFGTGFVEGVGTGIKDVANMGYQALKTVAQAGAVDLGFENGGVFGTDNLDALANLGTTISSNSNFDLMLKVVMTAGKALDDQLTELQKGDIDTNTANFGGKVAGNIVGNEIAGAAVAKTMGAAYDVTKTTVKGLFKGGEEALEAGKGLEKTTELAKGGEGLTTGEKPTVETTTPVETHGPPEASTGEVTESKPGEGPSSETKGTETKPTEGGGETTTKEGTPTPPKEEPPPAKEYDNSKPLADVKDKTQVKPLDDSTLTNLEEKNGFRKDHAERMNEFAQEKGVYLIVRDGNPDSVKFFGDEDKLAKPMTSKAKTAKVGPDKGLVVDPTHPKQAGYWDQAIADAEKAGDAEKLKKLTDARNKALDTWNKYGEDMLHHGYQVNPDTGVIEYNQLMPDGTTKTWTGVHGDYDLHGVYKANPDGTIEHVSFGSGNNLDANHFDTEGTVLRKQLNDAITSGGKDFIQHGGQDDWIPDPTKVPNKPPDPPATVFFPDGRPPVRLNNAQEMRDFYEKTMGVQFPYPDPSGAGAAGKATK